MAQYKVKNETSNAIFWWVGPNAFPHGGALPAGQTSATDNYSPSWDWFNVIDDPSKNAICQIKFPSNSQDFTATVSGGDHYRVTPGV